MKRRMPPQAILSVNNIEELRTAAQQHDDFAATESSLGEDTGGRWRFWRIGAALRICAMLREDDPAALAAYCERVDRERAEAAR